MADKPLGGTSIPEHPTFLTESERLIWRTLREQMRTEDVIICSRRFTDREGGDVEIDLLLLLPDVGAAIIEVKGGVVSYEDNKYILRNPGSQREIHPTEQGRRGMHALRGYLDRHPDWSHRPLLRSKWFCAFPYTLVDGDMGPEGLREQLIGSSDLENMHQRIYDVLAGLPFPGVPDNIFWTDEVTALIEGRPTRQTDIARFAADREDVVELMTRSQSRVVSMIDRNPRMQVVGPAGSGKSWIAMELARRWADAGLRVAYLTYGRGMAEHVERAGLANVAFIGTYHQLGYLWGISAPAGAQQSVWVDQIPAQMCDAARTLSQDQRFDAYIVDEAQDFADSWWDPLLLAARDVDQVRLAVFRDDAQEVFPGRRGHPDLPLFDVHLSENLRNASQIADAFAALVNEEMEVLGGPGMPVQFVECSDEVEGVASDIAVRLIETGGWTRDQIAVLTTKSRHFLQKEAQESLGQEGYWDQLWSGDDIFYGTVAGFKGLERPVIVLAVNGFHDEVEARGVMYTGMSRARDLLIVVGDPESMNAAVGADLVTRLRTGTG